MENMYVGVDCRRSNDIFLDNCIISESNYGLLTHFLENMIVEDTHFSENTVHIWTFMDENITLNSCEFLAKMVGSLIFDGLSNALITKCKFYENGLSIYSGKNVCIENCSFTNGTLLLCKNTENLVIGNCNFLATYGARIYTVNNTIISNCRFYSSKWEGILIGKSRNVTVKQCIIENGWDRGIFIKDSCKTKIIGCEIYKNPYGVYLLNSMENVIAENKFIGNECNAWFENSFLNIWFHNYWDDWLGIGPKIIWGRMYICNFSIPWFSVDFFPKARQSPFHYLYIINFHLHPWLESQQGCIGMSKAE